MRKGAFCDFLALGAPLRFANMCADMIGLQRVREFFVKLLHIVPEVLRYSPMQGPVHSLPKVFHFC